jgi:hypothetical protein
MITPVAFEVFSPYDDLLERRTALEQTDNIEDMWTYAAAWLRLADDFQSAGLLTNAANCRERGTRYGGFPGGEYVRLYEGSLAELVEVPA